MADYSEFPFHMWDINELGQMLIEAVNLGDGDFADALREQIKQRRPEKEKPMNVLEIYDKTNRYKKRGKSAAYFAALEIAAWMSVNTLRTGLPARNQIASQLKADAGTFDYPHLTAADFRDVAAKARRVILSKKRRG